MGALPASVPSRTVRAVGGPVPTLIVASAGGHLAQAHRLLSAVPEGDRLWVSYGVAHARSLLSGESLLHAHHPTTKHVPNAVRNYRLARRIYAEHDVSRVVSTGAAIAVPFMLRARQLGIPCHYIESATRVEGPSLSGRLLARMPGVKLYRQLGQWGGSRWQQGPCVFDGYAAERASGREIRRVVVSLGTHDFPFTAAVSRLAELLSDPTVDVLWQLGSTPDPGHLPGRVVSRLPADELQRESAAADVVVGHAGVGLSLTALAAGKVPVLLPRRRRRREHTDDHQQQLARELQRRGLAVTAEVEELAHDHLAHAATLRVAHSEPEPFVLID